MLFIQHLKCNLIDKPKIKSHDLFLSAFTELISEAVRELRDHVKMILIWNYFNISADSRLIVHHNPIGKFS